MIIPCYNQGKFLDEAVNSVLDQSYQNFEIIIINDGSTDEYTNKLLKNYKKRNTKVFHTRNQGLANARNYGFLHSEGSFIQFLDADDFLDKRKFEDQINVFKKNKNIDVSYTNYVYFYEEEKKYSESKMQDTLSSNPFNDFIYRWQRGLSIPIHCGLFKKSLWKNSNPFITGFRAVEDWIMWTNIASKGAKFELLNKNYAIYRIQGNNMTKDKDFMFYWVSRAVSYISENYIKVEERDKFDNESIKYLKYLSSIYYVNPLEDKIEKMQNSFDNITHSLLDTSQKLNSKESELEKEKEKYLKMKKEADENKKELIFITAELDQIKKRKIYRLDQFLRSFLQKP